MKIEVKIELDKNNSAEMLYKNILDGSAVSYNMLNTFDNSIPKLDIEVVEGDDTLEYRFKSTENLDIKDIEKLLNNSLELENFEGIS